MSDMLGHDELHFTADGLCECDCAECCTRFEHTIVKIERRRLTALQAKCICRACAHNKVRQ